MTNTENPSPRPSLEDLVTFSDAELDDYVARIRRARPGVKIVLPDKAAALEILTAAELDRLTERLRARGAVESLVDLDEASFLLEKWVESNEPPTFPRPNWYHPITPSPDSTPVTPPLSSRARMDMLRAREKAEHDELVQDGGRPWYPISLLDDVSENPEKYREMLSGWNYATPNGWTVFGKQLGLWRQFRMWQRDNRGIRQDEADFAIHMKVEAKWWQVPKSKESREAQIAERFKCWQRNREEQRQEVRDENGGDFLKYVESVSRRLTQHGFAWKVELDEDPNRQDSLTTWIEYVGFETWSADRCAAALESMEPQHTDAWNALQDAQVLRPDETEEFLRDEKNAEQRLDEQTAIEDAFNAAKSHAKSVAETTKKDTAGPHPPQFTAEQRVQMIKESHSKFKEAKSALERMERRNDLIDKFIYETRQYWSKKVHREHRRRMVQWGLEQIPLIRAELKSNAHQLPDGNKHQGPSLGVTAAAQTRAQSKRSCEDDDVDNEPSSKRLKDDSHEARVGQAKKRLDDSQPQDTKAGSDGGIDEPDAAQGETRIEKVSQAEKRPLDLGLQETTGDSPGGSQASDEEPPSKRQKKDSTEPNPQPMTADSTGEQPVIEEQTAGTSKVPPERRTKSKVTGQPGNGQGLRRSARIAALRAALQNPAPAPIPPPPTVSKPAKRPASTPRPTAPPNPRRPNRRQARASIPAPAPAPKPAKRRASAPKPATPPNPGRSSRQRAQAPVLPPAPVPKPAKRRASTPKLAPPQNPGRSSRQRARAQAPAPPPPPAPKPAKPPAQGKGKQTTKAKQGGKSTKTNNTAKRGRPPAKSKG